MSYRNEQKIKTAISAQCVICVCIYIYIMLNVTSIVTKENANFYTLQFSYQISKENTQTCTGTGILRISRRICTTDTTFLESVWYQKL